MINELPTVFEVVTGKVEQPKDAPRSNGNKSKPNGSAVNFTFSKSRIYILFMIFCCSSSSLGASKIMNLGF